jgi:hypothetical protein
MNGTVAALEKMLPAGCGHVINVISLAGLVAAPGEVNYSTIPRRPAPFPDSYSPPERSRPRSAS